MSIEDYLEFSLSDETMKEKAIKELIENIVDWVMEYVQFETGDAKKSINNFYATIKEMRHWLESLSKSSSKDTSKNSEKEKFTAKSDKLLHDITGLNTSTFADNLSKWIDQAGTASVAISELTKEMLSLSKTSEGFDPVNVVKYFNELRYGAETLAILGDAQTTWTRSWKNIQEIFRGTGAIFAQYSPNMSFLAKTELAFANISKNLTGMQKGLIGIATCFVEFKAVKGWFYDLMSGSENIIILQGKIAAAVGMAGMAFSSVFGFPAGIAVAGIVAVVAGFAGMKEAMDDIRAEHVGEAIHRALTNPGGTSLEAITESYQKMTQSIGDGFSDINEKAAGLSDTRENVETVADSIGLLQTAMENGAYTCEEKVAEIKQLFEQLLTDSQTVFDKEYDVIVAGLLGAFSDSMDGIGIEMPELMRLLNQTKSEHHKTLDEQIAAWEELEEKWENGALSEAEYTAELGNILTKINELNGATETYAQTVSHLQEFGSIDLDMMFSEGKLNTEYFRGQLTAYAETVTDTKGIITTGLKENETAWNSMIEEAKRQGDEYAAIKYAEILRIQNENGEAELKRADEIFLQYGNIFQRELLERVPNIIAEAKREYQEHHSWGETEDTYVKEALEKYANDFIKPAEDELKQFYSEYGLTMNTWASDSMKEAVGAMYTEIEQLSYDGTTIMKPIIKDNYEDLILSSLEDAINEAMPEIQESFTSQGEAVYISALDLLGQIVNAGEEARDPLIEMFNGLGIGVIGEGLLATIDSMDEETKARVVELLNQLKYASDEMRPMIIDELNGFGIAVSDLGLIRGISSKEDDACTSGDGLTQSALFGMMKDNAVDIAHKLGASLGQGYVDGIGSKIAAAAIETAKLVGGSLKTIQETQDSHSPSKVTRKLGTDFSEGYALGISDNEEDAEKIVENWMTRLQNQVTAFAQMPVEVEIARPEFPSIDYSAVVSGIFSNTFMVPIRAELELGMEPYMREVNRQNALLEEQNRLLRDIREKPVIQDSDVFSSYQRSQRDFFARTGRVGISGID